MEKKISFLSAALSSFLGVGGNMVLPARGGDILRLYYCKKETGIPYPNLLSKLFLEKVMDLTIVLFIGAVSFLFLGLSSKESNPIALFFSGFVVIGLISFLICLRFALEPITSLASLPFRLIRKEAYFQEKIQPHISELSRFLGWKTLAFPLLITVPTWTLGYAITYLLESHLIGIPLSYSQTLFMVFCGAMGVALPSAPSGVGVYHASLISGFILLGLDSTDGFLYAFSVHLLQFLILTSGYLIANFIWMGSPLAPRHKRETEDKSLH